MSYSTYDNGRYFSEGLMEILPNNWRGDRKRPGIVFCHAYGSLADEPRNLDGGSYDLWAKIDALVNAGYPVVSVDNAGNQWGNNTGIGTVEAAVNYMQTEVGAHATKVGLIGRSMGHLNAMNWAALNRSQVSFVVSLMGVCDLNHIQNMARYTDRVNQVYGGDYVESTHGPRHNPTNNAAAKYKGLPWQGWVGVDDATTPAAQATKLKNLIGSTAEINVSAGDHERGTISNWSTKRLLNFVQRNTFYPQT